jgi:hypothetical protein
MMTRYHVVLSALQELPIHQRERIRDRKGGRTDRTV